MQASKYYFWKYKISYFVYYWFVCLFFIQTKTKNPRLSQAAKAQAAEDLKATLIEKKAIKSTQPLDETDMDLAEQESPQDDSASCLILKSSLN